MFSDLIVAYLFLGGTGAGGCVVVAFLALLADPLPLEAALARKMRSSAADPWRRFFAAMQLAILGALLLGMLCLIADLGRPDRLLLILFHPAPTYLAFGAWALIACFALSAFSLLIWTGAARASRRVMVLVSIVSIVAGVAVMLYAGLMLADMRAVPVWNTPLLWVVFVLSALSCGIALVLVAAFASGSVGPFARTLMRLSKVDAVIILLEAIAGIAFLVSAWQQAGGLVGPTDGTSYAAQESLEALVAGPLAALFWVGFAFIGMAVPFVQDIILGRTSGTAVSAAMLRRRSLLMVSVAACVLIGGAVLRLLVVAMASHPLLGVPL